MTNDTKNLAENLLLGILSGGTHKDAKTAASFALDVAEAFDAEAQVRLEQTKEALGALRKQQEALAAAKAKAAEPAPQAPKPVKAKRAKRKTAHS